ncbi:MAG3960 family lipoprotein [Mycoplasma miroungirhinis]|uniref:Lipoprotein n=1 Tax=Mycoplasma miroungirhinis TaxID=754516 RepID=A0A6M4JAF7_9MOLU|nr:hypothetical protein [Mycoplasma miroungirhinis]QJR43943.1 hypothetical protein HLA92_00575 [Mycoplasma miroungirhinis]
MKKSKIKWLLSMSLGSTLLVLPLTTTACFFDHFDKPIPKPKKEEPSEPPKPNNPPKDNIETKQESNEVVNEFSYDGMKFKIAKEDTFDKTKKYYADMVLENDAFVFKTFLNTFGDYWINNLNEEDFPTLVDVSRYVRSLVVDNKGFMSRSNEDKNSISAKEYNKLITKLLEILDVKETYDLSNDKNKDKKISYAFNHDSAFDTLKRFYISRNNSYFNRLWNDWFQTMEENNTFGRKVIDNYMYDKDIHYSEISAKDSDAPETDIKGKRYKVPSVAWKLNRDIYLDNMFNNDMFLSRAFYEKSLNKDQALNNDWIDWLYLNDSSVLAMQVPQYKLLVAYLRLMKKLTDSINFETVDDEDKLKEAIKNNGSIVDGKISFEENLINSGISQLIDKYEKALLDYLALEHVMGFTAREDHDPNLQLFGGGTNYQYKVDYRDTYKWAKRQYEEFLLPFKFGLGNAIWAQSSSSSYQELFNNPQTIKKYELIWANIKAVDKIDKPELISKDLAKQRLNQIKSLFKNQFKWKFKE